MDRTGDEADEQTFLPLLSEYLPSASGPLLSLGICMYTNSPDGHFIVDRHPEHEQVTLATAFSGHGFKLGPVVGEMMADLIINGEKPEADVNMFSASRFAEGKGVAGRYEYSNVG